MSRHASTTYSSGSAELVYGIDLAGRIRHISEVKRGYACGCVCPACGVELIGKKGDDKAHHFGHRASFSCAGAPETALHRLAKEIVATELRLFVPEVKAVFRGMSKSIHDGKVVDLDTAVEEARNLRGLVPDILVARNGRHLLVEIYVTHACDELKLGMLRDNGVAAVEIDLSRFPRDAPRSAVRDAVIEQAGRKWLYHPEIDAEVEAMRAAHRDKEDARQRRFEEDVSAYLRRYDEGLKYLATRVISSPDKTREFFRIGLGAHIGLPVGGSGCFVVLETEWQFLVLGAFLPEDDKRRAYRHHAIFEWIKAKSLLRSSFHFVAPDMEEAMRVRNAQFMSPYRAIEAYLDELVSRGVLQKAKTYTLAMSVLETLLDLRESIERKRQRRTALVERIEKILGALPDDETEAFSLNDWMAQVQEDGMSFSVAIEADDEMFDEMLIPIRKIEAMMFRKGAAVVETLGLPIELEQARQMDARLREADEKQAAEKAKADQIEQAMRLAAQERGEALKAQVCPHGSEFVAWIEIDHPEFGGMTPLAAAIAGEDGAYRVNRLLQRKFDDRAREQARAAETQGWKSELERELIKTLKDKTQPFLDSPYPLGPHPKIKPRDYCVSKVTFEECLGLARKVAKKLR